MKKSLILAAIAALAGFSSPSLSAAKVYEKVTPSASLEEITDGNYIITCPKHGVVMKKIASTNVTFFPSVSLEGLTDATTTIEPSDDYAVVNITKVDGGYHLKYVSGEREQFITIAGSGKQSVTDDAKIATITYSNIGTRGDALQIYANPAQASFFIQYNNNAPRFAGYKTTSDIGLITLFKEVEKADPEPEPEPEPEPADRDKLIAGENDILLEGIDLSTGSLSPDGKIWTSNTTPAFTLTIAEAGDYNFATSGNGLLLTCGNSTAAHATVTIASADPAYFVSGYIFDAIGAGDGDPVTITYDEFDLVTTGETQYVWLDEIAEGTPAVFTATPGRNEYKKAIISNFDILLSPATQQPEPPVVDEPDYTTGLESVNNPRTDRYTTSLSFSDNKGHSGSLTGLQSTSNNPMYVDRSATAVITTHPGATITITPTTSNISWMHKYAYVDWGKDGFAFNGPDTYLEANGYAILPGADLVAFDFFNRAENYTTGYNSEGKSNVNYSGDINAPFSFSIPTDAELGSYRGRFKIDWNDLDPKGNQTPKTSGNYVGKPSIAGDGGIIVDFTIEVVEAEPEPVNPRPALTTAEGDILINVPALTDGGTLSNDGKLWTSNTTPAFTLTLTGDGKMEIVDDNPVFRIACGNNVNTPVTITVASADADYFVSGYLFDATGYAGDAAVITFGGSSFTTNGETQYAILNDIAEGTPATFTVATAVAANAKKPIISNFDVRFSPVTPEPVIPDYPDPATWDCLGHNGWTVTGCSQRGGSGDTDGGFAQLFDDNTATYWHSNWDIANEKKKEDYHFFIIDLGEGTHAYDGFGYLPRQMADGGNGYCQEYAVYVTDNISGISTAGSDANSYNNDSHPTIKTYMNDHTADAEGNMGYVIAAGANRAETRVAFTETKTGRYVIFVFKSTANSEPANNHANCAEFNLYAFRPEAAVDHRPEGIAWLDNNTLVQKVPVLFSTDDIAAAKDAVNALAEDATLDEVMTAARTIYNAPVGKHVRFLNVLTADRDNENYYLGGIEDYVHYTNDESDLSAVWVIKGTDTPGAYRLLNYGYQKYAGYDVADNTHQLWSTTGEEFEFVIPTSVDNNCHIADANQLGITSHEHLTAAHGCFHFATTVPADMKIVTWGIGSAASQWRISLADDNTTEVTGSYDSETGIYTIKSAVEANPFTHNATRHASHIIALDYQQPLAALFAAQSDETEEGAGETSADVALTEAGNGTYTLDLSGRPNGQYAISIPMGYFATPAGFSAAHTDVITHDYVTAITEISADAAAAAQWYTIQGQRVAAPVSGRIYLRATSTGVEKVLVK